MVSRGANPETNPSIVLNVRLRCLLVRDNFPTRYNSCMGDIKKRQPVKLIAGLIFKDKFTLHKAEGLLIKHFTPLDFESQILPFIHTHYYQKELGPNLLRKFISFKKLIPAEDLYKIKILTNKIERRLSVEKHRSVNIDPGYLDLSKLILATTKDYSHRIYLNDGIYAEVTLIYKDKNFQACVWTYPDYRTEPYLNFFLSLRNMV